MTGVVPSTSHCELGPCLVGGWVRGRIASCCSACFAVRCYCMTAGWGETEVPMDVSSRRLALVLHRCIAILLNMACFRFSVCLEPFDYT